MFRYNKAIRGIVIDIDSFSNDELMQWDEIVRLYPCLFLTADPDTNKRIKEAYGDVSYLLDAYETHFIPNNKIHINVLEKLEIKLSELVYVTKSYDFVIRALGYLCGIIWITDENVTYEQASRCPDLICHSISDFTLKIEKSSCEYYGEAPFNPSCNGKRSMIVSTSFEVENQTINLYSLGRYYGIKHYMHLIHPFSAAILQNKRRNGTGYKAFNPIFGELMSSVAKKMCEGYDCVCNVPPRIGEESRFNDIIDLISRNCNIEDVSRSLITVKDYPSQKSVSAEERQKNIKGAFNFDGNLNGKKVLLIDDIITTGETLKECVRVLLQHGAKEISIIVMGINQKEVAYWSSNRPVVISERCKAIMNLFINKTFRKPFYSCPVCMAETLDYNIAEQRIVTQMNSEIYSTLIEHWEDELY